MKKEDSSVNKLAFSLIVALIMSLSFTPSLKAEETAGGNPSGGTLYGPQVPLTEAFKAKVKGDYVAAGVGMRNLGHGDITISLRADSTIAKAFLYWAIIREPSSPASNTGTFNDEPITGTLVGTSGTPCWPSHLSRNLIDAYVADVTEIAIDGLNTLTGFPSGSTDGRPPATPPYDLPLLEGASLVVVFENPLFDFNTVVINDGAQTFSSEQIFTSFDSFTAVSGNDVVDQIAQTTYIVASGQARFPGSKASFDFTFVAGPDTPIKPSDAFNGADGISSVSRSDGLWDTLTIDVSSFFIPGVSISAPADVYASNDCLTYVAQILSVKTGAMDMIDIKPGSHPNSINPRSKGKIPVAILSTMDFDAPQEVDTETLTFGRTGDEDSLAFCNSSPEDVNDDGHDELICHFYTQEAGFECGDTEGILKGETLDGTPIEGSDSVRIVPSACQDEKPPRVKHTNTNTGPLRSYEITCQDQESGLAEIKVAESRNFEVDIPPFTAGTNDPIIVTATNENQSENSFVELEVIDVAGNVTYYDPEENPASEEQKSSGGSSSVLGCFIATAADG